MPSLPTHSFKRLVLGLQMGGPHRTLRLGVEFANRLHLDLLGLFVEDADLRQLAQLPFARELRPLGAGWQPVELDRLSRELDLAARRTERLFVDAAKDLIGKHQFEVFRGSAKETIASVSRADDIVMIAEMSTAPERVTHQFSSFSQAALQSTASVMLAPLHPARSAGSVAVIARSADDRTIETAAAIAAAAYEELIIISVSENAAPPTHAGTIDNLAIRRGYLTVGAQALVDARALVHALEGMRVRLLVVPRRVISDAMAHSIASLWRIPVLMTEPATSTRSRALEPH